VYIHPLQAVRRSCHRDCPEEVLELCTKAGAIANTMLMDLGSFLVTLVKFLWDNMNALHAQCHPIEAGKRIERMVQAKNRGGSAAAAAVASQEVMPGAESEVWAKKQIEKFVLIQQHLSWLVTGAMEKGSFTVHNLQYNPAQYVQEHILTYFSSRLHGLFPAPGDHQQAQRFSQSLHRLTCGCVSVQYVLRLLNADIGAAVQDLFYNEFQEGSLVPPPGIPVPLYIQLDSEKLISKIAMWFVELTQKIAHTSSGLVWVPCQKRFVNATHSGVNSDYQVDVFLNHDELVQLVTMVGVQGVRAIESQLLTLVGDQVQDLLLPFLARLPLLFVGDCIVYLPINGSTFFSAFCLMTYSLFYLPCCLNGVRLKLSQSLFRTTNTT
jgi:hypothetical protein